MSSAPSMSAPGPELDRRIRLVKFVGATFVFTTALAIIVLFVYRMIWIAAVYRLFGVRMVEMPEPYFGIIWISTGDPGLVIFVLAFVMLTPFLIWRRELVQSVAPWIDAALKAMVLYSLAMIALQHLVVVSAIAFAGRERSDILFSTSVRLFSPDDTRTILIIPPVNDPHYVTLILSFVGLMLISDAQLFGRIWRYLTDWWDARPK